MRIEQPARRNAGAGASPAPRSQLETPASSAASIPAARAPAMSVSSWSPIITSAAAATPSRRAASANRCGSGLPRWAKRRPAAGEPAGERGLDQQRDRAGGEAELATALGIDRGPGSAGPAPGRRPASTARTTAESASFDPGQEVEAIVVADRERIDLERSARAAPTTPPPCSTYARESAVPSTQRRARRRARGRGSSRAARLPDVTNRSAGDRDAVAREPRGVGRRRCATHRW